MTPDSKIKDDAYLVLQPFMIKDLKLKGNELIVYACIYSFSQADNKAFSGSLQYLADWTNSTKQGVLNCLKKLIEKGYIQKTIKGVNKVEYSTKFNALLNKVEYPIKKSLIDGVNKVDPIIKIDNKEDIKDINNISTPTATNPTKHKYGEHKNVLLTDEEYTKLKERFPTDYEEKINTLSEGLALKGYKYKSHYLAVIKWAKNDENKTVKTTETKKYGGVYL